jgi:hypothetical protein
MVMVPLRKVCVMMPVWRSPNFSASEEQGFGHYIPLKLTVNVIGYVFVSNEEEFELDLGLHARPTSRGWSCGP